MLELCPFEGGLAGLFWNFITVGSIFLMKGQVHSSNLLLLPT
jgi:hypothetical protein